MKISEIAEKLKSYVSLLGTRLVSGCVGGTLLEAEEQRNERFLETT
jgi:hypothetical protein